jgi:hypothetical protein
MVVAVLMVKISAGINAWSKVVERHEILMLGNWLALLKLSVLESFW